MGAIAERSGQPRILIVGGGASGVLLAVQLLRLDPTLTVALVEKRDTLGLGLAYSTRDPDHLLNVRNANMSAFDDDPDHFRRWLANDTDVAFTDIDPAGFASRHAYGRYIASLLAPLACSASFGGNRIVITHGTCIDIEESAKGIVAHLIDGRTVAADIAVLATGHDDAPAALPWLSDPWNGALLHDGVDDAPMLIAGSGLSMIDRTVSLIRDGHTGPIIALSRRGLLPHTHRPVRSIKVEWPEIPVSGGPLALLRWMRSRAREIEATGGTWRDLVDGIRPYVQAIWQSFDIKQRQQFLRHARLYWDIHRHRMAPTIEHLIRQAIERGQLRLLAGELCHVEAAGNRYTVTYRRRGYETMETMSVARVFNCTGTALNPASASSTLTRNLLAKGMIRTDRIGIGLDVTANCNLIDQSGFAQPRFFAVGPLTRAACWEITAIPDIRVQAKQLATHLIGLSQPGRDDARDAAPVIGRGGSDSGLIVGSDSR